MLTENDREFLDYYIANKYSSTKAALETGRYKNEGSAAAAATRILKKPAAQEYIRWRVDQRRREKGVIASIDDVLEFYSGVMKGTITRKKIVAVSSEGEPVEIEVPPTLTESLKGADGLAKAYGLNEIKQKLDVGEDTLRTLTDLSIKEKKAILEAAAKDFR